LDALLKRQNQRPYEGRQEKDMFRNETLLIGKKDPLPKKETHVRKLSLTTRFEEGRLLVGELARGPEAE